jgi:hypothetical protein
MNRARSAASIASRTVFQGQLIRQDLERDAREKVEALLLEGVHSKKRIKVTPKWWEEKEARVASTSRRTAKRA